MRSINSKFATRTGRVALENTDGLSAEAKEAIGAGNKPIPAPKKEGEVTPAQSVAGDPTEPVAGATKEGKQPTEKKDVGSSAVTKEGEVPAGQAVAGDPTEPVATGGEGKTKPLPGTAGALEQRRIAVEDDGRAIDAGELEEMRRTVAIADQRLAGGPAEGEEVTGDPSEAAAGAEGAEGVEPGDGGEAQATGGASEVPAGEPEAIGEVTDGAVAEAGAALPSGEEGEVAEGVLEPIDQDELANARRLVAEADRRLAGRSAEAPVNAEPVVDEAAAGAEATGEVTGEVVDAALTPDGSGVTEVEAGTGTEAPAGTEGGEEAGVLPTEVQAEAELGDENASGLERELTDVADAEDELDDTDEEIEKGTDVVEALEAMREALSIATESGGLDRHGAAQMKIAFESNLRFIKYPIPHMVSLESFGGVSKKITASQLSMETIGETIKGVIAKVIAAIKASIQKMAEFAQKLDVAAIALDKRAKMLVERAENATWPRPAESQFEDEELAKILVVNGKVDAVANIRSLSEKIKAVREGYNHWAAGAAGVVSKLDGEVTDEGFIQAIDGMEAHKVYAKLFTRQDGGGHATTDVLPGNRIITSAIEEVSGKTTTTVEYDEKARGAEGHKFEVLKPEAIKALAKEVEALAGEIRQARQDVIKGTNAKKQLVEALTKRHEASGTTDAFKPIMGVISAADVPFRVLNQLGMHVASATLRLIQKNMSMYKEGQPYFKDGQSTKPA